MKLDLQPSIRRFRYEQRACECCGGNFLEALWEHRFTARTRNSAWQFEMRHVICTGCGFAFVSPCPSAEDLRAYYEDSYSYVTAQSLDYDVRKRLDLVERHARPGAETFLEIGSNIRTLFHERLEALFSRVITMEVNQEVDSTLDSLTGVADGTADMVASYFVLEHVPDVDRFVADCARIVKPGGVMVIEIPEIALYRDDISALIFHEHVNHFSLNSFSRIAARHGFELREGSVEACSRGFGFAAVYVKHPQAVAAEFSNEYEANRASFQAGLSRIERYFSKLRDYQARVQALCEAGKRVTLWGANANLQFFLNGFSLPAGVRVVDSSPGKKDFLGEIPVFLPAEAAEHIAGSETLLIFAGEVHKPDILRTIRENFGKTFADDQVHVIFE